MCNYHGWNKGNCRHSQDVAVTCRSNKGGQLKKESNYVGISFPNIKVVYLITVFIF